MKLKLKEDPREWRKAALFGTLGLGILATILRWRTVLSNLAWCAAIAGLALVALCAVLKPQWFRGWYVTSSKVAFSITQIVGYALLLIIFLLILTPLGIVLRLTGKDLLGLKRQRSAESYWHPAKPTGPPERLF